MGGISEQGVKRSLDFLRERKKAFCIAFGLDKIATCIRRAYCQVFGGPSGQMVLADLAKFCRADRSCLDEGADPRMHAVYEGRREVWLRIQQHLRLTPEELFQLYSGHTVVRLIKQQEKDNE